MRSTGVALLFPIALFAAGCGCRGNSDGGGADVVARLGDHHMLAAPVTVGNLTVWPVRTDRPLDLGEFLTLEEALAKGAAEVREIGGAAAAQTAQQCEEPARVPAGEPAQRREPTRTLQTEGQTLEQVAQQLEELGQLEQQAAQNAGGATVGTLVVENRGDLPILVCAGTVVKGGNQDRQIGQDFVIKARSETPVDAFCVEQGRWQAARLGEDTGGKFQVLDGMATAKVRAKGQYEKDQGGVWQEVGEAREAIVRMHFNTQVVAVNATPSVPAGDSTSYAVAFDANAEASKEELSRCEDAVKKHFAADDGAVGFAYAINGRPVAVRTFAHPRLLGKHLDDFVRGMATEALLAKTDAPGKPADPRDVVALVAKISTSGETVAETRALNKNGIRLHDAGYNANCYVADKDGNLAPLTQDWTAK
ncbi:MAG: hypothetical protein L6Q95_03670 [Planctomycetes bacterium]|nr:hypothetical protein [Planctomycetota bacterium]